MGRLDDAAKHKVVELRKAGLSFRKIKAVLELENIKVSAQAIYLFLREFQGRPPGRVRPMQAGSSTTTAHVQARAGAIQESWSNIHLQNLLREASHHSGFTAAADFAKQTSTNPEASAKQPGYGETSGGSRPEQQPKGNKEENDIQIVSVTSLAQSSQQRGPQSTVTRAETGTVSSTPTASGAFVRRRVTPSPATNSMLAARKRLLDKALSHRMKSFHQVVSLLRKHHSSVQGSDLRSAMPQPSETYDLTTEKTVMEGQPGGGGAPRRFVTQRPSLSQRSPHPAPRVGIRLPNRSPAPLTTSAPGGAVIRLQAPGGQGATRSDGNPSPQQAIQDSGGRSGLQDQIQTLGSEVRSLGLAVKMLVDQQCRLEREQAQQTHIQKQILSTLQSLASKLGHCSSSQQQHNKTPSPSALPAASASTSFSQDTFSFSQGTYSQCSQTQPSYNSLESLENVEAFKLPGLSPTSMNGFPPCNNTENLPLTHTPPQTQPYAAAYTQQTSQTLMPPYTQSYVPTYSQSHSQSFRISENKSSVFPSSCSARTLQDCSVSAQPVVTSDHSAQDQHINIIKVEGP
ncbi:flocculation protein FLO11-like [Xiphias gladius]|uniref:flocculation protein FLO11-like n=1 Tax=Xiphias gladius TaxID=8245 RepID=UPI001A99465E|nr:flocculation protein FLO11-like [Xiphias gladius]